MGAKRPELAPLRAEIQRRLAALRVEISDGLCFICEEPLPPKPEGSRPARKRFMHDECRTDYHSIYDVIKREAKRALNIPWSVIDPNRNRRVIAWQRRKREARREAQDS